MHAEVKVGDSWLMLGEAQGQYKAAPTNLYLYVPNTDKVYAQALKAGGSSVLEPADQFYGDRNAGVKDPSGNIWWVATHLEDVTPEELERRSAKRQKQKAAALA
jgi:uncharacterized glyoxalase superfamily protein PhnB